MSKNIAVILAGGSGIRMGNPIPKQFLKVAGKKIIEHTLSVFENNALIDEICVVSKSGFVSEVENLIVLGQYKKVKKVLVGGEQRYQSSLAAIRAYNNDDDNLIFHDAVRPLVNDRIIEDCVKALETYNAVDVAIKTTDTIVRSNDKNCIVDIPNRMELRNGQTPQCFKLGTIKKAYEFALEDANFSTTDDCGVVRKYLPKEPIFIVSGEIFNMKLTYLEDLFLLDKLFQLRSTKGIDMALTDNTKKLLSNSVVVVFGGSYGIGKEIVDLCVEYNCRVYSFSRTLNNVDVSKIESVEKALAEVFDEEGKIDAVIDTAGVLYKEALESMRLDDIENSININLLGVINVARASFLYLKQTCGSLLFYTSSSYTRGRMMYSVYSATKAAIVNFVQAMAEEWSCFNIRVNCINPERTKTPMRISNFGNEPEGSLLDPKHVAMASINTIFSKCSGEVVDVRKHV